ncbi:MAG: PLP-dependent aspartate aminotransferase family protein [Planctomycetota bacterium]|nr:PLP-dependent aspartate aminotransferase family protein [Planctomycetota bacterium]
MRRDTEIQHHGDDRRAHHGAAAPVVYRTALFTLPDSASIEAYFRGARQHYLYSRDSNPTVRMLEEKFARLEGAEGALAYASGMAAISGVLLSFLSAGDHLVLLSRAYAPTLILARQVLSRLGVSVTLLEPSEVPDLAGHLRETTRVVYVESPASLTFDVVDLEAVAVAVRGRDIITVTDNSWATPIFQRPLEAGIDLALHSGTKYVGGHSDVLLGLVAGAGETIGRLREVGSLLGASLSPADAALAVRGLRTLPLRMERHRQSALVLARRLEEHPRVERVLHPALESFPGHALWKRQFSGSSGLFSFVVDGDARRVADALRLFLLGVSWGGNESLALPLVATTSGDARKDARPDVPPGLIRLSVGLEDPEDLWADLEQALGALPIL